MRPIGKMTRGSYNIRACTTRIYVAFYVYSLRTFILTVLRTTVGNGVIDPPQLWIPPGHNALTNVRTSTA